MNITLTGTHSVGKTTLGRGLYQHYCNSRKTFFAEGIPRSIIARGYSLGASATMASYTEYIIEQLSALSQASRYEIYLSDRSLLDPYAYALSNQQNGQSLITLRELELLHRVWELEQKEYNLYLYLPVQFPMSNDGIRPVGEGYRELVSQTILNLLEDYQLPYFTITSGPEEMLQQAIARIDSLLLADCPPFS